MQFSLILNFCASVLGTIALFALPSSCSFSTPLQTITTNLEISQASGENAASRLNHDAILQDLVTADVIYLGETHAHPADHEAQLQIIQALYQNDLPLAIGLEMFQRPFQPILDAYLQGELTELELRTQSEYDRRWGYSWEYYAPILRFAQQHQLPLLALNTPTEVTRKVARHGLSSLTDAEMEHIPPISEIDTRNRDYRAWIKTIFEQHLQHGHGSSPASEEGFENFFAAQVLWDETMADRIVTFLEQKSGHKIVVLLGQGHVIYDYGVPSRVDRRIPAELKQYTILLNPSLAMQREGTNRIADYFWITE